MQIKHLGHSSFKIKGITTNGESVTVVTDPFNPGVVGLPYPKQETDIVTSSHEGHGDHDWYAGIKGNAGQDYFLINTPGEYEIKGLRVFGIKSFHDNKQGAERGPNTIYVYDFKAVRVAHLGDLGHKLDSDQMEAMEGVDILLLPIGGVFTIDPATAVQVIEAVEPKIAIPMHYRISKSSSSFEKLATLEDFLKEAGVQTRPQEQLKIKSRSDLPHETQIMPLS